MTSIEIIETRETALAIERETTSTLVALRINHATVPLHPSILEKHGEQFRGETWDKSKHLHVASCIVNDCWHHILMIIGNAPHTVTVSEKKHRKRRTRHDAGSRSCATSKLLLLYGRQPLRRLEIEVSEADIQDELKM